MVSYYDSYGNAYNKVKQKLDICNFNGLDVSKYETEFNKINKVVNLQLERLMTQYLGKYITNQETVYRNATKALEEVNKAMQADETINHLFVIPVIASKPSKNKGILEGIKKMFK